jgi:nucleotide-binding universal stress UspA family protein
MFKHLLVPLDGSTTAEVVLPAAAYLAKTLHARVTLMHVIEADAPPQVHGEHHLTEKGEAAAYLERISRQFFAQGQVTCHVHTAAMQDVGSGIVLHEAELAPDLVILCTHGRGGLRGMLFGRIAQQVAASGSLPVLLIRPESPLASKDFACRRLLVPADAMDRHPQGPDVAIDLARATGARLELLTVVPKLGSLSGRPATARRFAPGATQMMLELEAADGEKYLQALAADCLAAGVAVGSHLKRGEPAAVIAEAAEGLNVDLIVLGTHGKAGTKAFWSCSVGSAILARTFRPALLVPAGSEGSACTAT